MPTERMEEVEVVCGSCGGRGCQHCLGYGAYKGIAPEGSLTSARLRLADAAEAWMNAIGPNEDAETEAAATTEREFDAAYKAVAALRTARGEG